MNISELKVELLKNIELLNKAELEQIYSLIQNFVTKNTSEDFDNLSQTQQEGLINAIEEMNYSEGTDHQSVIDKYKKKYA